MLVKAGMYHDQRSVRGGVGRTACSSRKTDCSLPCSRILATKRIFRAIAILDSNSEGAWGEKKKAALAHQKHIHCKLEVKYLKSCYSFSASSKLEIHITHKVLNALFIKTILITLQHNREGEGGYNAQLKLQFKNKYTFQNYLYIQRKGILIDLS